MLNLRSLDPLIELAFEEDIGIGDITTEATVPPTQKGIGILLAKSDGIVAGLPVAERVFEKLDATLTFRRLVKEGEAVGADTLIAEVHGSAKTILIGERTALNFLQRLSGIATLTAQFVETVAGYDTKIVDTRKTAAGWRAVQKYAVRVGGAQNHRFGLYDGVLIKDNHIVAAGGIGNAVQGARQIVPHTVKIEVEVETVEQVDEALKAGADILLLDNMPPGIMQRVVQEVSHRAVTEASGGITLDSVKAVAATGVDFISVGALTHSAMPMDISLNLTLVAT
ncbi:carboxylating nicotinate-nucleotide diphosphorylase [Candidatus Poribacteria bacterium]|nr:carboxylating nicotinate-nucleotide diphosphorylase [Candidatus Poribacteria bacterium]MYG08341.1 carboxylating nicotinate-nucleotide diphosphorylase [Candidatus Poribacteria bacterium]MYK24188.1 carboxylating nicotinate-nucleotide diphosphorylase [Candidatus Poribacteria bacterium]